MSAFLAATMNCGYPGASHCWIVGLLCANSGADDRMTTADTAAPVINRVESRMKPSVQVELK